MVTAIDDRHRATKRRSTLLGGLPKAGVLAAAGLGTAMAALLASPAFADKAMDVQMLQTAASIENLAVATYDTALTLDFIGGGSANAVVKAFVEKTKEQHQQHAEAFNAAATRLGGKAQDQPDPGAARRGEQRQARAHRSRGGGRARDRARGRRGADVRRQHRRVREQERPLGLRQHHGRRGAARRHPPARCRRSSRRCGRPHRPAAGRQPKLPAAAGSVGFPDAFYPTTDARPANEGAVQ